MAFAIAACMGSAALTPTFAAAQAPTAQQSAGSSPQGQPGAGTPGPGTGQAPSVSATLEQCLTAVDASGRSATFSGQMVAVAGTARMTMRIDVQERVPGDALFHTLNAPGLGMWRRSGGGVKIYKYLRQVTNLPAPAAFRAIVRFRWLNDQGHLIKHTERHTPSCEQPDGRPKLVVGIVRATATAGATQAEYQIVVHNEGHGAAGPFGVLLSVNGLAQPLHNVATLAGGARTVLDVQGPRCTPGSKLEVQLDPSHQVPESPGGGLPYTAPCPLGETGGGTVGDTSSSPVTPTG